MLVSQQISMDQILIFINTYNNMLAEGYVDLELKSKTIGHANREQPSFLSFYDEKRIEVYSLYQYVEMEIHRFKGQLWKDMTVSNNYDLTKIDKDQFINSNIEYLELRRIFLSVSELYQKYESVVNSFKQRGYSLKNITDLKIHALEDSII